MLRVTSRLVTHINRRNLSVRTCHVTRNLTAHILVKHNRNAQGTKNSIKQSIDTPNNSVYRIPYTLKHTNEKGQYDEPFNYRPSRKTVT
jgi:hypothetical protein